MREKVFIVGGGPSLYGFNFNRLKDHDTIVVNDSVFCTPQPTYFVTMDYTWTLKHDIKYGKISCQNDTAFFNPSMKRFFLVSFGGDRLGITKYGIIDRVKGVSYDLRIFDVVIHTSGYGGFGGSFGDFRSGSDSGYAAIQLAAALGYKDIYLLGLDFVVEDMSSCVPIQSPGATIRTGHKAGASIVSSIRLESRTHFHAKTSRARGKELQAKLDEFLGPYPGMLLEARNAGFHITSCSKISKLNKWIPYVDVGALV